MSKIGNYIVGASVVAVLGGAAANMDDADKQILEKQIDKVEHVRDELRNNLKESATIAWNRAVRNVQRLQEKVKELTDVDFLKQELKEDSHFAYETIEQLGKTPRIKDLQYQNDTLAVKSSVDAYYTEDYNTITDNVVDGAEPEYEEKLSSLAHEAEHMHQHNKVNFKAGMSVEQHYKIHCYKEIGARIAGLLQYRQMYKEAKTDKERQEICEKGSNDGYRYYFEALENGEINPRSGVKKDFDKEMEFIAVKTVGDWMNSYAQGYDKTHIMMVRNDVDVNNLKPNDENYNKAVSALMTMGGIDFSSYIEDIDVSWVNSTVIKADEMIKNGKSAEIAMEYVAESEDERYNYLWVAGKDEYNGFSLEQKYNLAINEFYASFYKDSRFIVQDICDGNFGKDIFEDGIKYISDANSVYTHSFWLLNDLCEENSFGQKASDEEYQKRLKEIWTMEDYFSGNKICLLDAIGVKEPDFSSYVAEPDKLREKDNSPILEQIEGLGKDLLKKVKSITQNFKEEKTSKSFDDVIKNEPLMKPRYDLSRAKRGSDVYMTSQVIDTRTDFLKKERDERESGGGKLKNKAKTNMSLLQKGRGR